MSMRWMIRGAFVTSFTFVAGMAVVGCSSSDKNGFPCASQAPLCPDNFACVSGLCWKNGTAPAVDVDGGNGRVDASASAIDAAVAAVDGPRQSGVDGPTDTGAAPVDLGGAHDIGAVDVIETKVDATIPVDTTPDVPLGADVPLSPDVSISVDVGSDITVVTCGPSNNGVSCGAGRVCNAGACQDGCWIAGAFVASGGGNASNVCQICAPSKSTTDWSNNDAKTAVACGSCGGTAACVGGALGPCSVNAGTFYPDSDGDGYGATTGAVTACTKPAGYVTNNKDCCDTDPDTFPGQTNTFSTINKCNSFDYNCDGKATAQSNGPTSCGPGKCAIVETSSGKTCVQQGCDGCNSNCQTWTVAACGQTFSTSVSACAGYYDGGGNFGCTTAGNGGPAGTQKCN